MTTKDCYLSLKGKHEILFPSNGQYSNLNLNGYNKYSNLSSPYLSTASYISSRKEDISIFGEKINCHGKNNISNSWTKADFKKHDLFGQNFNGRNDKGNDMNVQSDNLSLHIESYEAYIKSIGATSEKDLNAKSTNSSMKQSGSCNKWKSAKEILTNPSSVVQNPFELPRQQSQFDGDKEKPEISQFKASQKLLAPQDNGYDKNNTDIKTSNVIRAKNGNYKLVHRISHHFFKATDEHSKRIVMIKFFGAEGQHKFLKERDVYGKLAKLRSPHFLQLIDFGKLGSSNFLVLSEYTSTIHEKFPFGGNAERFDSNRDPKKFNNFTKVILAKNMLQSLQQLHALNIVHGNLGFDNYGINSDDTIVLTGFDFANKSGEVPSTMLHILPNVRYASRAFHAGGAIHFKDEVESLLFMVVEFFKDLPWLNEPPNVMEFMKDEALCKNSAFIGSLPFALRFMFNAIMKQSYDKPVNYQQLLYNMDNIFTAKEMIPVLPWKDSMVYLGMLAPPHLSIPFFVIDHQKLAMIYKCDKFSAEKIPNIFYSQKKCGCCIVFKGDLTTYSHGSLANDKMMEKKFHCDFHQKELTYIHTCSRTIDHPYFQPEAEEKEKKDYIVNASDYPPELVDQLEKLTCQTGRSEFVESDFPDCETANLITQYD